MLDSWLGWDEPKECHSANLHSSHLGGFAWAAQQVWNLRLLTPSQKYLPRVTNQVLALFHSTDSYNEPGVWRHSSSSVTKLFWWCRTFIKTTFITAIVHLQVWIDMQKISHCISKYRRTVTPLTECITLMITQGFKLLCLMSGCMQKVCLMSCVRKEGDSQTSATNWDFSKRNSMLSQHSVTLVLLQVHQDGRWNWIPVNVHFKACYWQEEEGLANTDFKCSPVG